MAPLRVALAFSNAGFLFEVFLRDGLDSITRLHEIAAYEPIWMRRDESGTWCCACFGTPHVFEENCTPPDNILAFYNNHISKD